MDRALHKHDPRQTHRPALQLSTQDPLRNGAHADTHYELELSVLVVTNC